MVVPETLVFSRVEKQHATHFDLTSQQLHDVVTAAKVLAESSPMEVKGYRQLIEQSHQGDKEAQRVVLELARLMQVLREAAQSTENDS